MPGSGNAINAIGTASLNTPLPPLRAGAPPIRAPQSKSQHDARVPGLSFQASHYVQILSSTRAERPWIALIAVPLAMTATIDAAFLSDFEAVPLWIAWLPLAVCAWWWAPRHAFRWSFLLALEAAVVGVQWSLLGALSLAEWPDSRALVAGIWIGAALLIAFVAALSRWRYRAPGR